MISTPKSSLRASIIIFALSAQACIEPVVEEGYCYQDGRSLDENALLSDRCCLSDMECINFFAYERSDELPYFARCRKNVDHRFGRCVIDCVGNCACTDDVQCALASGGDGAPYVCRISLPSEIPVCETSSVGYPCAACLPSLASF